MKYLKIYNTIGISLILIVNLMILPGCSTTVPLQEKFPQAPKELLQPAPNLKSLSSDKKTLADLLENANENYGTYYETKAKLNAWIEWYNKQKKIFEGVQDGFNIRSIESNGSKQQSK